MFIPGANDSFGIALFDAAMLGLGAALPALILSYARELLLARRIRPEFVLYKSETFELNRAILLHEKVDRRLKEIAELEQPAKPFWRGYLSAHPGTEETAAEREDLLVHARQLRTIVTEIRARPLLRLKAWIGINSSRFALGKAITVHVVSFGLLLWLAFHPELAWSQDYTDVIGPDFIWNPFERQLLYANAIAAGFATMAAPMFYFIRWLALRQQYDLEIRIFNDLAKAGPERPIDANGAEAAASDSAQPQSLSEPETGRHDWFAVLGLSQSASIDEIKAAYKTLIKQNHPDRVHGMSPAFRKLAEVQTQKINTAYRQALSTACTA